jgi:hypothetical protein
LEIPLPLPYMYKLIFDNSGGKYCTREAPAYRIIPLNVAYHACETSQRTENLPLIVFFLKAFPLIEIHLYMHYQ